MYDGVTYILCVYKNCTITLHMLCRHICIEMMRVRVRAFFSGSPMSFQDLNVNAAFQPEFGAHRSVKVPSQRIVPGIPWLV